MIALLAAAALAAEPTGFRLGPAGPGLMLAARQVLVVAPDDASLWQLAPRVRVGNEVYSLDLEVYGLRTWAPGWSRAGISSFLLGSRVHLGQDRRLALGAELVGELGGGDAWGSRSREAYGAFLLIGEIALEDPVAIDGPRGLLRWGVGGSDDLGLLGELALAGVFPAGERLAVVAEGELALGERPRTAVRPLLRASIGDAWALDAGLQLPLAELGRSAFNVQAIAQVSWSLPEQ